VLRGQPHAARKQLLHAPPPLWVAIAVVKKRGMFDDTSAEVERLTMSIKEDMQSTSARLDGLQVSPRCQRARRAALRGSRAARARVQRSPSRRPAAAAAHLVPLAGVHCQQARQCALARRAARKAVDAARAGPARLARVASQTLGLEGSLSRCTSGSGPTSARSRTAAAGSSASCTTGGRHSRPAPAPHPTPHAPHTVPALVESYEIAKALTPHPHARNPIHHLIISNFSALL
jgi:hypothetical protein